MAYKKRFLRLWISSAAALSMSGGLLASAQQTNLTESEVNLPVELEYIEPGPEAISVGKAGERPANIARYLMAQGAGSARLAPKSDQIAFISDITGKRQLWVLSVEGGQAKQLTFGNGVTFFEWRPENQDAISNADQSLIYGADNNGDEQETYFLIQADGQLEAEILPPSQGGFRVFGGFNADGSELSYASTERNGLDFDIYVKSLLVGSDSEPRRVFEGQYGNFVEAVSPDGNTLILSSSVGEDSDNLYALNVQTGVRTVLSQPSPRANHTDAGVMFLDESTLLFATNKSREFMALTMLSLTTGEEKTLFESDADVDNVMLCGPNKKQGVADWVTALEVASPALKASDIIEYGDINDDKWRDFYTNQSPIRTAHKIKVPVLFPHGVMDPRIDITETETMVRALRANGIQAPFIRIPDEGHGWRKLSNQLFYYRRQAEF